MLPEGTLKDSITCRRTASAAPAARAASVAILIHRTKPSELRWLGDGDLNPRDAPLDVHAAPRGALIRAVR